ncbi:MAG: succinate dehydrogenase, hydrophobic membrane anchor protein [Coxiella sp. (in: Bacteria)]|nr:MAG: succinate dehydrogenase, hydrophobic membrane anchor protein [Coxiella sp. (in: g-proteobacteria)]
MVNQIINQRGFREWLVQRITALLIGSYAIVVVVYCLAFPHMNYITWLHLYGSVWMRIYTVIVLFSILWHAWIGLWTVFTDYVKPKAIRLLLEIGLLLVLTVYMVWCLDVLWA